MDYDRESITQSAEETAKFGESLANTLSRQSSVVSRQQGSKGRGATVICLYGDLGSGKTTFAQGFAKGLGIPSRLLSPTFIIVRRYEMPQSEGFLYHLDLYRVGGEKNLEGLGISEILTDSDSYVLIEWAEKLEGLLPDRRIDIRFSLNKGGRHSIVV